MARNEGQRRKDTAADRWVREAEAEHTRWLEERRRDREPGARNRKVWAALTEVGRPESRERRPQRGRDGR
jgi:hypothetical protein